MIALRCIATVMDPVIVRTKTFETDFESDNDNDGNGDDDEWSIFDDKDE